MGAAADWKSALKFYVLERTMACSGEFDDSRRGLARAVLKAPESADAWLAFLTNEERISSQNVPAAEATTEVNIIDLYGWATKTVADPGRKRDPAYWDLRIGYARLKWSGNKISSRHIFKDLLHKCNGHYAPIWLEYAALEFKSGSVSQAIRILEKGLGCKRTAPRDILETARREIKEGSFSYHPWVSASFAGIDWEPGSTGRGCPVMEPTSHLQETTGCTSVELTELSHHQQSRGEPALKDAGEPRTGSFVKELTCSSEVLHQRPAGNQSRFDGVGVSSQADRSTSVATATSFLSVGDHSKARARLRCFGAARRMPLSPRNEELENGKNDLKRKVEEGGAGTLTGADCIETPHSAKKCKALAATENSFTGGHTAELEGNHCPVVQLHQPQHQAIDRSTGQSNISLGSKHGREAVVHVDATKDSGRCLSPNAPQNGDRTIPALMQLSGMPPIEEVDSGILDECQCVEKAKVSKKMETGNSQPNGPLVHPNVQKDNINATGGIDTLKQQRISKEVCADEGCVSRNLASASCDNDSGGQSYKDWQRAEITKSTSRRESSCETDQQEDEQGGAKNPTDQRLTGAPPNMPCLEKPQPEAGSASKAANPAPAAVLPVAVLSQETGHALPVLAQPKAPGWGQSRDADAPRKSANGAPTALQQSPQACPSGEQEQDGQLPVHHPGKTVHLKNLGAVQLSFADIVDTGPAPEDGSVVYVKGKKYCKLALLGRGGFSRVYKVVDTASCAICALKHCVVRQRDSQFVKSVVEEVELLKRLRGKRRIVQLIDHQYFKQAGVIYILEELGEIDLAGLLHNHAALRLAEGATGPDWCHIQSLWKQMVEAVMTIHEARIVHSDLKPANFLLVKGALKLIDFGIAREIQGQTTSVSGQQQAGTLNYMAPETLMPGKKVGRPSDIWSLGCILYEMVYSKTPFQHITNTYAKVSAITDPLCKVEYPDCGDNEVVRLMQSCLVFHAAQRITLEEMLDHPFVHPNRRPLLSVGSPELNKLHSIIKDTLVQVAAEPVESDLELLSKQMVSQLQQ